MRSLLSTGWPGCGCGSLRATTSANLALSWLSTGPFCCHGAGSRCRRRAELRPPRRWPARSAPRRSRHVTGPPEDLRVRHNLRQLCDRLRDRASVRSRGRRDRRGRLVGAALDDAGEEPAGAAEQGRLAFRLRRFPGGGVASRGLRLFRFDARRLGLCGGQPFGFEPFGLGLLGRFTLRLDARRFGQRGRGLFGFEALGLALGGLLGFETRGLLRSGAFGFGALRRFCFLRGGAVRFLLRRRRFLRRNALCFCFAAAAFSAATRSASCFVAAAFSAARRSASRLAASAFSASAWRRLCLCRLCLSQPSPLRCGRLRLALPLRAWRSRPSPRRAARRRCGRLRAAPPGRPRDWRRPAVRLPCARLRPSRPPGARHPHARSRA